MDNNSMHLSTSILQLPDDCLYSIFRRLDSSSDRESFGLTCHRLLHIQSSSRRSLQFQCSFTHLDRASPSRPPTKINSVSPYKLLKRFQQLKSLSLPGCTDLTDQGLSLLLEYGSKLHILNLDCCFGITEHGFSIIAIRCPLLTIVSLCRCKIKDTGLEILSKSCLGLKDVNLSYCAHISDKGIRALSQNCCHLRAVVISHCINVCGIGFQGCSQTLAYLEADSCRLEPEGIQAIVSGGGLEYLNISDLHWRGHGLQAMETLSISKLRVLNFRLCRTIGDDVIEKIAKGCPLLQEWNLALCDGFTVAGWEAIGTNCHNLERLHVNRCRNLCDEGLQALRDGCKRLRKLYLSRRGRTSWAAIEMFKCLRRNVLIVDEEIMCIAPDWAFKLQ